MGRISESLGSSQTTRPRDQYGPDSLQFVRGDPHPEILTKVSVDRGSSTAIHFARGALAGLNLIVEAETSSDGHVFNVEVTGLHCFNDTRAQYT